MRIRRPTLWPRCSMIRRLHGSCPRVWQWSAKHCWAFACRGWRGHCHTARHRLSRRWQAGQDWLRQPALEPEPGICGSNPSPAIPNVGPDHHRWSAGADPQSPVQSTDTDQTRQIRWQPVKMVSQFFSSRASPQGRAACGNATAWQVRVLAAVYRR